MTMRRATFPSWLRYMAAIASVIFVLLLTQILLFRSPTYSLGRGLVSLLGLTVFALMALLINARRGAQKQAAERWWVLAARKTGGRCSPPDTGSTFPSRWNRPSW
jgi:hypothetical protein